MAESTALTVIPNESMALSFDDTLKLGGVLVKSGYFRDMRDASQAVVKILMGREFGIGPMTAIRGIHIVEGKPELSAGLMAGLLQKAGYTWIAHTMDENECDLEFFHRGVSIGRVIYTIDDAKEAGLAGKSNWRSYGADMLFARCISRGARRFAPGVLMGNAYVEGEIQATSTPITPVADDNGNTVEGEYTKELPIPTPSTPPPSAAAATATPPAAPAGEGGWSEEECMALKLRFRKAGMPVELRDNAMALWQLEGQSIVAANREFDALYKGWKGDPDATQIDVRDLLAEAQGHAG